MRRWLAIGLGGLSVVACSPRPAPKLSGDGQLVLELGGASKSLSASLRALGVELLPVREVPASPVPPPAEPTPGPSGDERRDAPPAPPVPPVADATFFEVELQARQTLMDLAHRHLGSGLRFKELLTLNGWTEKQARRLKAGQKVKIPRVAAR